MNNNIKKRLANEKGITLVALLITVIVMMIIVGISVDTGTESLDSTRLQGFYMQLETIQKRADDIATTNEGYYITNADGTKTEVFAAEGAQLECYNLHTVKVSNDIVIKKIAVK